MDAREQLNSLNRLVQRITASTSKRVKSDGAIEIIIDNRYRYAGEDPTLGNDFSGAIFIDSDSKADFAKGVFRNGKLHEGRMLFQGAPTVERCWYTIENGDFVPMKESESASVLRIWEDANGKKHHSVRRNPSPKPSKKDLQARAKYGAQDNLAQLAAEIEDDAPSPTPAAKKAAKAPAPKKSPKLPKQKSPEELAEEERRQQQSAADKKRRYAMELSQKKQNVSHAIADGEASELSDGIVKDQSLQELCEPDLEKIEFDPEKFINDSLRGSLSYSPRDLPISQNAKVDKNFWKPPAQPKITSAQRTGLQSREK